MTSANAQRTEARWIPWMLAAATAMLLLPRLGTPDRYIFDEVYHAYTAGEYVQGNRDAYRWDTSSPDEHVAYMWNHPPLGVWMIATGISIWGNDSFGWRFSSVIFGALAVVILYLTTRAITGSVGIAMLAACLLMMDGLFFTQSRTGMLDIYGVVFVLCALWSLYAYLTAPPNRIRGPLLLIGCFLGLAIATKWNAGFPALFTGLAVLGRSALRIRSYFENPSESNRLAVREHLIWVPIALAVCPAAVYLLTYVPFFLAGNGWADFIELQKQIFLYHTGLKDAHPYFSRWWEWPLATRPVWYAVDRVGDLSARIYAGGNPFLYWLLVPAVCWVLWLWRRDKKPAAVVLAIGFFGQWLPWAAVSRIAFAYHFLPAVPFGCMALAVSLARISGKGFAGRVAAAVAVLLILIGFVYFYPLHAHVPLSKVAIQHRMWFTAWR
jgi:dolichyl-phosphate-mannose--protein O-mannosyl transferase